MPFTDYATIGEVALAYQITLARREVRGVLERPISDILREELAFAAKHAAYNLSEAAVCENLIYPILKEVWKSYLQELMLWSHQPIRYDAVLSGIPDYSVGRLSPLGRWSWNRPLFLSLRPTR